MITLILIVCSMAAPFDCKEVPLRPVFSDGMGGGVPMSMFDCTMHGQQIAQDWLGEHPNWMLYKWRCQVDHRGERPA